MLHVGAVASLYFAATSTGAGSTDLGSGNGPAKGSTSWRAAELQLARPASALAAGLHAARTGDAELSVWLLAETAARHPIVADYADLMRAEQLLALARHRETATLLERTMDRWPDSPLFADFAAVLGEAFVGLGDEAAARHAWRQALDASDDDALRSSLLAATARSEERSGDAAAAATSWNVLWYLYPTGLDAQLATESLDRLEPLVGPRRDAIGWQRRADRLFRKRSNEAALEAYEIALEEGIGGSQATRVKHRKAQTLFRMRDYPRAVEAFGEIPQVDDVPIWHARSLARAGRVPEAIREFETLATRRRGNIALRARFLAALLLDGRGRLEEARHHLESLTHRGHRSGVRRAALWRLGWGAYRSGHHAEAIRFLDQLIEVVDHPIDRLRSRYWRARCMEAIARLSGPNDRDLALAIAPALREFEAIARAFPLSYYGWRARLRLPNRDESGPSAMLPEDEVKPANVPAIGTRRVPARELERARILLEAGLEQRARDVLARAARQARGLDDRLEVALLLRNAGDYRAAQRLVLDPYQEILARGPARSLEELWWHSWPAAFSELVRKATAAEGSVEPSLVLSIMREESGFRPKVVSPVGARGLLQIMEPTGARLAAAVGHPNFDADDLFVPLTNIRLGSHYLSELYTQFDGRLSAAIASYNAGPIVVREWLEQRPEADDDEWVESIPYDQTRGYVKRVLRSLQAYRLLY